MIAVFAFGAIVSAAIRLSEKVTAQFTLVPVPGAARRRCACDCFQP
jgi:hypothetical protein